MEEGSMNLFMKNTDSTMWFCLQFYSERQTRKHKQIFIQDLDVSYESKV